jgi:hypothetical protein
MSGRASSGSSEAGASEGGTTIWHRLLGLDHRILSTLVAVIIAYVMLNPFKIPFPVTQYGQDYYDFVTGIEPGSIVGFMCSDTPSTKPSLQPASVLMMQILLENDCKMIFWQDEAFGPPIYEEYIALAQSRIDKQLEYGVDYINLGYIAGTESGTAAFLADIRKTTGSIDAYGNDIEQYPIMQGVNTGSDFDYGFANVACRCTEPLYVRQWADPYDVPLATINCAMDLTAVQPYLATGQMEATANGLLGSAEMEYLTGSLGLAFGQTLSVSMAGLYFVILIILGNVFFFISRGAGPQEVS